MSTVIYVEEPNKQFCLRTGIVTLISGAQESEPRVVLVNLMSMNKQTYDYLFPQNETKEITVQRSVPTPEHTHTEDLELRRSFVKKSRLTDIGKGPKFANVVDTRTKKLLVEWVGRFYLHAGEDSSALEHRLHKKTGADFSVYWTFTLPELELLLVVFPKAGRMVANRVRVAKHKLEHAVLGAVTFGSSVKSVCLLTAGQVLVCCRKGSFVVQTDFATGTAIEPKHTQLAAKKVCCAAVFGELLVCAVLSKRHRAAELWLFDKSDFRFRSSLVLATNTAGSKVAVVAVFVAGASLLVVDNTNRVFVVVVESGTESGRGLCARVAHCFSDRELYGFTKAAFCEQRNTLLVGTKTGTVAVYKVENRRVNKVKQVVSQNMAGLRVHSLAFCSAGVGVFSSRTANNKVRLLDAQTAVVPDKLCFKRRRVVSCEAVPTADDNDACLLVVGTTRGEVELYITSAV